LAVIAAGGFFLVGVLSIAPALALRRNFDHGRILLGRARTAFLNGNLSSASRDFRAARTDFETAANQRGNFLLRIDGLVPYLGRTPRALLAIADIGERISSAGVDVSAEVARLPGGRSSLGPTNGQIPLDRLGAVAPAVHRARISVDVAVALAERLPSSWLLGPVAAARNLVADRLDQIAPLARSADALLHSMPAFAGQDGPKRYFVAIQNTTEFRGTGGLIGNYAILTLDHGRMSLSPFRDARELANLRASDALSPSRDFTDLYGPFGGGGFWLNLNMTPDAPTAAILIESLYQQVQDQHLDGTIFFDLEGLSDMLRATGPVNVPAIG